MTFFRKIVSKAYVVVFAFVVLMAISAHFGMFWGFTYDELFKGKRATSHPFTIEDAQKIFPEAASMRRLSLDELVIKNVDDEELGSILHNMPSCEKIIGYASYIPFYVGVDKDKNILGLVLQENKETPWFIKKIEAAGLLQAWNGVETEAAIFHKVDAVSGATMTSKAIMDGVRLRMAAYEEVEAERQGLTFGQMAIEALAWGFFGVSIFAFLPKSPLAKRRRYVLLGAVLVPGFLLARFLSLDLLENWAITGIPLSSKLYMVALFVISIFVPLFTGKGYYCAWYCPFGAAQELVGSFRKKKISFSGGTGRFLIKLRIMILIVVCLLLLMGVALNLNYVEPFSAFAVRSAPAGVLYFALVVLILSIFIRRPWCNYFCPTGQVLDCVRRGYNCEGKECQSDEKDSRGTYKVKISEVINLLLVVVIIVVLMGQGGVSERKAAPLTGAEARIEGGKPKAAAAKTEEAVAKKQPVKGAEKMQENQVLRVIHQRKSVRTYTDRAVTKEQFETLVRAGMAAPTARNIQPWQFVVVDDKEKLAKMAEGLPYGKMLDKAPGAIVVCGEIVEHPEKGMEQLWVLDCSAATQNILLAAESMGLGAVWTAAYPYEERMQVVSEVLGLPEEIKPLSVVPVGYPGGDEKPKDKWKAEKLHWNEKK